jgi:hypothetical protein
LPSVSTDGLKIRNQTKTIMKTKIFFFAMLANITASATVTVTPLDVNYGAKTVKFRVAWTGTAANNRVWVWVDLCPIAGTTAGTFAKAVISGATATAGSITTVAGNTRGFYVTANPSTVTATLSNATGKFNCCVYGSDFPPNAIDNSSGGYALRGSPPFIITTSSGTTAVSAKTYSGGTITALTDATGCPGVLCGKDGETAGLLNCCVTGITNCSGMCMSNCQSCAGCSLLRSGGENYSAFLYRAAGSYCCTSVGKLYCDASRYTYTYKWYMWENGNWVFKETESHETSFGAYQCCN